MVLQRVLLVSLAAMVLSACVHSASGGSMAGRSPDAGAVALRFAWPEGDVAQVTVRRETQQVGSPPTHVVARRSIRTERRGDETWIFTRDIAALGDEPDLESSLRVGEAVVQVVGPSGSFRRAEGLERALMLVAPRDAAESEALRRSLTLAAAEDWELTVGAWTGKVLVEGTVHRKQFPGSVPMVASAESLLDVEYGLEGRVPCDDRATGRDCLELWYRGETAASDRSLTLERLRKIFARHPGNPFVEDFHARFDATVVTEPGTLLPHHIRLREHLRLRLRFPDGRVEEVEGRAEDDHRFFPAERAGAATAPMVEPRAMASREARRDGQETVRTFGR
jgi:hypothetical protein